MSNLISWISVLVTVAFLLKKPVLQWVGRIQYMRGFKKGVYEVLFLALLLSGCGGGGGGGMTETRPPTVIPDQPVMMPMEPVMPEQPEMPDPPMEPVTLPMDSVIHENYNAIDPLPSFRSASVPVSSRFDYERDVPSGSPSLSITQYTAPGAEMPAELTPMLRRAAKLWTRRIEGLNTPGGVHQSFPHAEPGADERINLDFLVGYGQPRCPREACANHYGDNLMNPSGRANGGRNPHVTVKPEFPIVHVRDGDLTIGGFRVLAHEFGHVLDHGDELNTGRYHSDCRGGALMCDLWESNVPAVPVERDFDDIRHHYDLRPHIDYEQFGIWAEVQGDDSSLERFGVLVKRTLVVEDATDIWDVAASEFIRDQISIETVVQGNASAGPQPGTGTVSWTGDLIAVDTTRFQPVLGAAHLSMDLAAIESMDVSFTDLHRTDDSGRTHDVLSLDYTLEQRGTTWVDSNGTISANFYAVGSNPGGAVAGKLNDETQNLMGAFGALMDE